MVLGKKGQGMPVNLIILIIIGLFVFWVAYSGFIKPSGDGGGLFKNQIDAFKDKKFSLMDFDTLTKEEKQKAGEESPRAVVENTINKIKNLIPGDCSKAKNIAELLKDGMVSGFDKTFEITVADLDTLDKQIQRANDCINTIEREMKEIRDKDEQVSESFSSSDVYGELYDEILKLYEIAITKYNIEVGDRGSCNFVTGTLRELDEKVDEILVLNRAQKEAGKKLTSEQSNHLDNIIAQTRFFRHSCTLKMGNCDALDTDVNGNQIRFLPSPEYSFQDHGNSRLDSSLLGEKVRTVFLMDQATCLKTDLKYSESWTNVVKAHKSDSSSGYYLSRRQEFIDMVFVHIIEHVREDTRMEDFYNDNGKEWIVSNNYVGCPKDGIEETSEISKCHEFNEEVILKFLGRDGINLVSGLQDAVQKGVIGTEHKNKFLCKYETGGEDQCSSCSGVQKCENYDTNGDGWTTVCSSDPCLVGKGGGGPRMCYAVDNSAWAVFSGDHCRTTQ